MEETVKILIEYIKEFVPANKGHVITLGIGLLIMGACLVMTCVTSGLSGELTYLFLHPGVSGIAIISGIVLVLAGALMKLPTVVK